MSSLYLPSELVFEILIKLPAKTLIRFQCLSKSIQAMITDPTFISTHRDRWAAINHSGGGGSYIIQFHEEKAFRIFLSCVDDDGKVGIHGNVSKLPDELLGSDTYLNIIGSCHGLSCFTAKGYGEFPYTDIYLCNPTIRVFKKLPDPNLSLPCDLLKGKSHYTCGVGFDGRSNDYKVVQIIYEHFQYHTIGNSWRCRIYSLSTNSWRWIESCPSIDHVDHGYYKQPGTCVKGCLYWIAREFISSFNLSDETFEIIRSPLYNEELYTATFGLVNESLALYVEVEEHHHINVWVLKKELSEGGGVGSSSWSKINTIYNYGPRKYTIINDFELSGEPLLQRRKGKHLHSLGVWDITEHKFKKLGIKLDGAASHVYPSWESLVLLN